MRIYLTAGYQIAKRNQTKLKYKRLPLSYKHLEELPSS